MSRIIYNPDGTLTDSALMDTILWTERRGMNLVDLAKEFGTDPKVLGIAVQRARASGAYMDKRKELIEKDMLKRDKPIVPGPKPVEQQPEQKPKPASKTKAPTGKERREHAKRLIAQGATPEEAAKAAGYANAKRMLAAFAQANTRAAQATAPAERSPALPPPATYPDPPPPPATTAEAAPPDETPVAKSGSLTPAYLGDDHVYVLGTQGLDVIQISDAGFIPWSELEEIMAMRKGAVK